MTQKEIEKKLERIYKEMSLWPEVNKKLRYKVPEQEVQRRESTLSLQQILYKIEDAKKEENKNKEYFNLALYYLMKSVEV